MIRRVLRKRLNEFKPLLPGRTIDDYRTGDIGTRPDVAVTADEAGLITSEVYGTPGFHAPVIDLDFGAQLIPSSTPGKYHLYLDVMMSERRYMRLLRALAKAGVIEEGYYEASKARGYSAVRLPWVRKGVVDDTLAPNREAF